METIIRERLEEVRRQKMVLADRLAKLTEAEWILTRRLHRIQRDKIETRKLDETLDSMSIGDMTLLLGKLKARLA
jgi:hypothetical protein